MVIRCAVNGCSNNRRKLNEWKQTFCELHQQKHEDCSCMIPYRLHTMPSNESMRLQWANTLNRKSLSKQVFACSEHFLDGKPTERNPYFGDTVSTSSGHKTEHLPEAICEFNVLEPSSVSTGTQYKYSLF